MKMNNDGYMSTERIMPNNHEEFKSLKRSILIREQLLEQIKRTKRSIKIDKMFLKIAKKNLINRDNEIAKAREH